MSGAPEEDVVASADEPEVEDALEGELLSFGQTLVAQGFAPQEEVDLAVQLQTQLAGRGVFLRLGELLVARGVISEETVAEVLELQGTRILVCPQCLAQFNILIFQRGKAYRCSRCRTELVGSEALARVSVEDTLIHSDLEIDPVSLDQGGAREFGNYVILGQISRGGMGIIYKARQEALDRVVALKVMTDSKSTDGEARRRFMDEARAVAKLRHPNIVAVYEVGSVGGVQFFTMEYVEGFPLQRAVTSEGLDQRELAEVFAKLCDAVDYANKEGLLHRDIKPSNILLTPRHAPVLIDFGIAGKLGESEEQEDSYIVGSPAYLPPEYVTGEGGYGVRGEVYALGASLYTVLAGRPPHTGIDTVAVLKSAGVEPVVPLRTVRRTVDPGLARIVATAMMRDPSRRYASAAGMGEDLRRWLQGEEVVADAGPLARAWARVRGRVAAGFGLALALVLVSTTGTYSVSMIQARQEEEETERRHALELRALRVQLVEERLGRARLLIETGRAAAAVALLNTVLEKGGEELTAGRIYALRAEALVAMGDAQGAARDRERARQLTTR